MDLRRLKPIVNDPAYAVPLGEYLDWIHMQKLRELEVLQDDKDIYRAQGFVQAVKQLKNLRETVNNVK